MAVTIPAFGDLRAAGVAQLQTSLKATVNGQQVPADTDPGSTLGALVDAVALLLSAFYQQLASVQGALTLATATGSDLDALVALLGVTRKPGVGAIVPVKVTITPSGSATPIPAGRRVLAYDASGAPTVVFVTQQATNAPAGNAGSIAAGQTVGWVWAAAQVPGAAGDIAAGQIAVLGDPIAGVVGVSNPQVPTPLSPTITNVGTPGTTTWQYALSATGLSGSTPLSAIAQTTTSTSSLGVSNYNLISWTAPTDAATVVVWKNNGSPSVPVWNVLATVAGTVTSVQDTGQACSIVPLPLPINTTNAATGGVDPETDAALRLRAPTTLQQTSTCTVPAIAAAAAAINGVSRVFVQDAVISGSGPAPGTFAVYVVGQTVPLPTVTQTALTTLLQTSEAAGTVGSWSQLIPTALAVAYTIHLPAGITVPSTLVASINAAITAAINALPLGGGVSLLNLGGVIGNQIASLGGTVTSVVMTVGGTSYGTSQVSQDVPGVPGAVYGPGVLTATVVIS